MTEVSKNQQVINRPTQCFIDGYENNNGNLALEFEQCVELFYLKSVDKGMVSFCHLMSLYFI